MGPRSNFKICRGGLRIVFPPRCTHSWPVTASSVAGLLLADILQIEGQRANASNAERDLARSPFVIDSGPARGDHYSALEYQPHGYFVREFSLSAITVVHRTQ